MMNKDEIRALERYGYDTTDIEKPDNQMITGIIIISKGRKDLHDSGYPFIQIFGDYSKESDRRVGKLVDLGRSDHIGFYYTKSLNIDSLGKNIFRLWPINKRVRKEFLGLSSLMINGDSSELI